MSKGLKLSIIIACTAVLVFSSIALAQSNARVQLQNTINQVLTELKDPALKAPASRDVVLKRVENIIGTLFDYEELSARTVGPSWKNFSAEQKTAFLAAFTTLLRETYLEKLEGYNGETVDYLGEEVTPDGKRVRIQTAVQVKGKSVPVTYSMLNKKHWVVYDVTIEGVSMVQNYRSQFKELLLKNDVDLLISQVEKKAQSLKAHNKKQQVN